MVRFVFWKRTNYTNSCIRNSSKSEEVIPNDFEELGAIQNINKTVNFYCKLLDRATKIFLNSKAEVFIIHYFQTLFSLCIGFSVLKNILNNIFQKQWFLVALSKRAFNPAPCIKVLSEIKEILMECYRDIIVRKNVHKIVNF